MLLRFGEACRKGGARKQGDSDVSSDQNYRAAAQTYEGFVGMVKWGTIGCILVATFVVLLLAS